ncbi:hypothetical protein HNR42_001166 [Deinobacterium chartae]|uniref:Uncharacterized protein n=1 Tax=Deinobacterium chartae TaxID=521158 RepID=A0A841HZX4_9DEIO|nr:hypothetical protein [Deinobacterium chartae]MBB6097749.1 hypothetical protein [Deinobacterium chartae]
MTPTFDKLETAYRRCTGRLHDAQRTAARAHEASALKRLCQIEQDLDELFQRGDARGLMAQRSAIDEVLARIRNSRSARH